MVPNLEPPHDLDFEPAFSKSTVKTKRPPSAASKKKLILSQLLEVFHRGAQSGTATFSQPRTLHVPVLKQGWTAPGSGFSSLPFEIYLLSIRCVLVRYSICHYCYYFTNV